MNTNFPDVFVVGAQKCGTTLLYAMLKQHPDIYVPEQKETHYFITKGSKLSYSDDAAVKLNATSICEESEYLELFSKAKGRLRCEVCPTYLYDKHAASKIFKANSHAKIVIMLRDPIERAFSAYKHMKARGGEKSSSFDLALKKERYYIENNWQAMAHYLHGSMYFEQVKRYLDIFPQQNVKIINFESFKLDPESNINSLVDWLGVRPFPSGIKAAQKNKTFMVKNSMISSLLIKQPPYVRRLKKLIPKSKRAILKETILGFFDSNEEKITSSDVDYLECNLNDDIAKLRRLTGATFDNWKV